MIKKLKKILKPINQDIFNEILGIQFEFGFQSGRWEQNEYLQDEIASNEFFYITNKCKEHKFKYKIDWKELWNVAKEYDEEEISSVDIIDGNISKHNYWQFDALACDIENQLINYLKKQL